MAGDEETFELPVTFGDAEMVFSAKLVTMGYTYKIYVKVQDEDIIFEPDEERQLRAVSDPEKNTKKISLLLVRAIGEALEKALR